MSVVRKILGVLYTVANFLYILLQDYIWWGLGLNWWRVSPTTIYVVKQLLSMQHEIDIRLWLSLIVGEFQNQQPRINNFHWRIDMFFTSLLVQSLVLIFLKVILMGILCLLLAPQVVYDHFQQSLVVNITCSLLAGVTGIQDRVDYPPPVSLVPMLQIHQHCCPSDLSILSYQNYFENNKVSTDLVKLHTC